MYKRLSEASRSHPGSRHIATASDTLILPRPGGDHHCLVQKPMWDSWRDLLYRNPANRFSDDLLKEGLKQLFLALDFLHTECRIIHTGKDQSAYNSLIYGNLIPLYSPSRYQSRQYPPRHCRQ